MLSPRLRTIVGVVGFEAITESHLQALVDSHASEDQDLDFKESWYARGSKGSFELPKDVAAFANQVGGLVIVGVKESGGVAAALKPVEIEAEQEPGIRQLLASRVFPIVQGVRFRVVYSGSADGFGYYLLAIPRSVDAPHGVLPSSGDEKRAMCWPVRNGTSTRYLAEAELATRYRDRFALLRNQVDRLAELHEQGDSRREPGQIVTLLVDMALAPR